MPSHSIHLHRRTAQQTKYLTVPKHLRCDAVVFDVPRLGLNLAFARRSRLSVHPADASGHANPRCHQRRKQIGQRRQIGAACCLKPGLIVSSQPVRRDC